MNRQDSDRGANPFPLSAAGRPVFDETLGGGRRPTLVFGPQRSSPAIAALISADTVEILGRALRNRDQGEAVRAGLLLAADHQDASHTLCQEIAGAEGSYWHAILHRREPDPSNAKYWLRRVGDHPVHAALSAAAEAVEGVDRALRGRAWDPYVFVERCESARRDGDPLRIAALEELQAIEIRELLIHCLQEASGAP